MGYVVTMCHNRVEKGLRGQTLLLSQVRTRYLFKKKIWYLNKVVIWVWLCDKWRFGSQILRKSWQTRAKKCQLRAIIIRKIFNKSILVTLSQGQNETKWQGGMTWKIAQKLVAEGWKQAKTSQKPVVRQEKTIVVVKPYIVTGSHS
jgi:hypothetical protein